ncbi:MAG: phosphatase PAP2 family protein [Gemmatimonadales bacterium]
MSVRGFLLLASLTLAQLPFPSAAVGQVAPRPQDASHPLLSGRNAAAAGLILAVTLMSDEGLRGEVQEHRSAGTNSLALVGNALGEPRYVLPALGAGYLAGRLTGNHALSRVALRAGGAAIVAGGLTTALKYAIGRSRPYQGGEADADQFRPFSGWNSFPSGHTTLAFAVATAIADETSDRWSDAALYGVATLTAFARVNDDRHWTSDVLVGALIGHLSARWLSRRQGWLTVGPGTIGTSLDF